ncbi:stage V sporulation protein B [Natranaerovirga pectinivora]|uniref:Stage V sporulation protein B n=1 Tax=Natranaerovirga pectinivora TaxID=682400 RepID=A0A4R3MN85_9FIRM|nr:polysaccharide biosynthesis protein [Natranaerovirga pectinivora]TCT15725.1 stage V sporulation protein B [Natranaerovirga pectinivora]
MSNSKTFIKGTLLLSLGGLITRILSMFFRIPLIYLTGDEGMGYYQNFYPVFMVLVSIAIVGMPQAISKIVSEKTATDNQQEAYAYFKVAIRLLCVFGLGLTLILFIGAHWLIKLASWPSNNIVVIYSLAISPFFVCLAGAIRGYFQGRQIMKPTAVSQIIEGFIKVVFGVGLTYVLIRNGFDIHIAIGGAALGASLGFICSALYLVYVWRKEKKKEEGLYNTIQYDWKKIAKQLILFSIPITIGASGYSIMTTIDAVTLFNRLRVVGIFSDEANIINGQIGKSFSIINVPLTLAVAIMISTVPAVAKAKHSKKELIESIATSIRLSLLFAFPCAVGLGILSKPVMQLIYQQNYLGYEYLRLYSICLFFLILGQALASILQGLGHYMVPVWTLLISGAFKIIINYVLIPTALLGQGALIGSIGFYFVFTVLNYIYLRKIIKEKIILLNHFIKILLSAGIMGIIVFITFNVFLGFLGTSITTLLSIGIGGIIYILLLFITKSIKEEDVAALPKHELIINGLKKFKLL